MANVRADVSVVRFFLVDALTRSARWLARTRLRMGMLKAHLHKQTHGTHPGQTNEPKTTLFRPCPAGYIDYFRCALL